MNLPRLSAVSLLSLLPACAGTPPPPEPGWRSVEFALGPHGLDEDAWDPIDSRVLGSLEWSLRQPGWPCGVEFAFQYARAESKDESAARGADFFALRAGAAGRWRASDWLVLVCGAGPRLGLVDLQRPGTFSEVTEHSSSFGVYAHAGAFVRVHGGFSVGVEGQWSAGSDYDVLGASRDASATELLLALRWDF